jgi:alpha-ketoglutarate-dependent taurine dioxygenase
MDAGFTVGTLAGDKPLPVLVAPRTAAALETLQPAWSDIDALLLQHGGVLLRGFAVADAAAFRDFVAAAGSPLLSYEFGSTPRTQVTGGIYTSTEYPAHQTIPLHNEQSYTREWPLRICFYCAQPSQQGGETPIGDSRTIYRDMDDAIRRRFAEKELLYVRNYGNGFDVSWQKVFNTADKAAVENYCRQHDIAWEWKDDGELRTRQRCQAVARHPRTGANVWFNQAHLFHVSALGADVREVLLDAVGEENLPRNVYYGDGSPIEDTLLDSIRHTLTEHEVRFTWRAGDVLVLDNMLAAHGRAPFSGPRQVVVAMTNSYSAR